MKGDLELATQDRRDSVTSALELIADPETPFLPDKVHLRRLLGDIIWVMGTDTLLLTPELKTRIRDASVEEYLEGINRACDVAKLLAMALGTNEAFREYVQSEPEFDLTLGDIAQESIRSIAPSKGAPETILMVRYGFFWGCHELITTGYSNFYELFWRSKNR